MSHQYCTSNYNQLPTNQSPAIQPIYNQSLANQSIHNSPNYNKSLYNTFNYNQPILNRSNKNKSSDDQQKYNSSICSPSVNQTIYNPSNYNQPPINQSTLTNQEQQFVTSHNTYRNNVNPSAINMQPIQWSNDLASSAAKWASQCKWQHSQTPGVGENLYASSMRSPNTNNYDPSGAVVSWGNEKVNYDYNTNTCAPNQVCGHYTQVVWANSDKVGCAVQDCQNLQGTSWPNGGTFVVCQYSPPGNWIGQKPYNIIQ